jgi:hypothetical protein
MVVVRLIHELFRAFYSSATIALGAVTSARPKLQQNHRGGGIELRPAFSAAASPEPLLAELN